MQFVPGSAYTSKLVEGLQKGLDDFLSEYPDKHWIRHNVSREFAAALAALLDAGHSEIAPEVSRLFDFYDSLSTKPWLNLLHHVRGDDAS